jgi:hypothetical protein
MSTGYHGGFDSPENRQDIFKKGCLWLAGSTITRRQVEVLPG